MSRLNYGPADIPMVGKKAWIFAGSLSSSGYANTLYRTDNAGGTWNAVSATALQYMDYVNSSLAFAIFGGQTHITADGGGTWHDVLVFDGSNDSGTTNGYFMEHCVDLSSFAGQSDVRLRFQADWSSEWYYYYSWRLDDVRIIVPNELRSPYPAGAISILLLGG